MCWGAGGGGTGLGVDGGPRPKSAGWTPDRRADPGLSDGLSSQVSLGALAGGSARKLEAKLRKNKNRSWLIN